MKTWKLTKNLLSEQIGNMKAVRIEKKGKISS